MNSLFKKSAVAGMLAAVALTAVPIAPANAQSQADLQTTINALLAQVQSLQAKLNGGASATAFNYTWSRSLTIGSTGEDVRMLQKFLNRDADTRVALSGAGSAGNETTYFGPATSAAVAKFQNKYRSDILTPNGLITATGYFGPASIAKANALAKIGSTPVPPKPTTPNDDDDESPLRGEGALDSLEIETADDTEVREGASDAAIAEVTMEATDGDIEINRLDISLVAGVGNTEKDPWDTFEEVSLFVNGKKIAEKSIDERTDYVNRNLGTVRFTNLDLVIEEDEEVELTIAATIQSGVDGAGTAADWTVAVERIRYFDADGVATDESSLGDFGTGVSFEIVERGEGEELKFAIGNNSPKATTIIVDDGKKTTNKTILEYTIEAIDGDIELEKLYINLETGTAPINSVIDDVRLVIGGKTFKDESITTTGAYTATSALVMFDIDGDITIDEDDKETVKVVVDLKPQTAYQNGETLIAQVTSAERDMTDAEGNDDISTFSGSVVGKEQTLISEGITSPVGSVEFSTKTQGQNDTTGIFTVEFEVTAVEDDFYIRDFASTSAATTTGGFKFSVESAAGAPTNLSASINTTADEDTNGVYTVREGQTETFTLNIVVDASAPGQHRVILDNIFFSEDTDGVTNARAYRLTPVNEYRSPYLYIHN
ncbi:MAG TPA: peptidoglycan-binding protein [Candidatus Paceibacterota bacterium]